MADRGWMYSGWKRGRPTNEWVEKTNEFLDRAYSIPELVESDTIKCPCAMCRNYFRHKRPKIELHLCHNGYKENYQTWTSHGERRENHEHVIGLEVQPEGFGETDRMDDMLVDLAGGHPPLDEETPTGFAEAFYRMAVSADERVHDQTLHSRLSTVARLLAIKSQYNLSVACYDNYVGLVHELLPPNSKIPQDFYRSKKLLEGLGMQYHKIDVCEKNCMLYYKDNKNKDTCDICGTSRYKDGSNKVPRKVLRYLPITDRLQRLYAHEGTAKLMRSHKEDHVARSTKMLHPCHGKAWKQFDDDFPDFAEDARNVRLGFATDGFTPYKLNAASYSCWPVFWVPYNLPPGVCMKPEYIFLAMVIPGPEHPGNKLSVLLQPMIDELLNLWAGVKTYDASVKRHFTMRASYLWSIHDFPAYGMFAGWSTHGIFACPQCMCEGNAYRLKKGLKATWFDCHRRFLPIDHPFRNEANAFRKGKVVHEGPPRSLTGVEVKDQLYRLVDDTDKYGKQHNWKYISGLWQLPYFTKLLLRHNIDVMHNEKNVAEAIWNTCFDIKDKTKDNVKARQDIELLCDRPSLHLYKRNGKWQRPRAPYCIDKDDKIKILNWFQELKFPDGYAANIRRGVNLLQKKIFGLKSHDFHIFIERVLPVHFEGFLPEGIWTSLAE
ncbi:uncharacterized protein [Miscanthus floridulus]|uniref:uncharacterized protein n=1 Tax=Miscanthus floridulus TaxID=154761 RepID=UPI003457670D